MSYAFFEDQLAQAKSIEDIFDSKMSLDDAKKYISEYIAKNPGKFDPNGKISERDFMSERLKYMYAIKMVIANDIGLDNKKLGVSIYDTKNMEKPSDMDEEIFSWLKTGRGNWSEVSKEQQERTGFLGVASMQKDTLLNFDTYNFTRIFCHELGHTRQTVLGTLDNEGDKHIDEVTGKYLLENPSEKDRKTIWSKKFIEKDADSFADTMCWRLISQASKDCGFSGKIFSLKMRAAQTAMQTKWKHLKGDIFYPMVEARAKKFNMAQEEQNQSVPERC